jgi:hypothetical protein
MLKPIPYHPGPQQTRLTYHLSNKEVTLIGQRFKQMLGVKLKKSRNTYYSKTNEYDYYCSLHGGIKINLIIHSYFKNNNINVGFFSYYILG